VGFARAASKIMPTFTPKVSLRWKQKGTEDPSREVQA
jgi:hypothetical protein